jgi:hypothetical protein
MYVKKGYESKKDTRTDRYVYNRYQYSPSEISNIGEIKDDQRVYTNHNETRER